MRPAFVLFERRREIQGPLFGFLKTIRPTRTPMAKATTVTIIIPMSARNIQVFQTMPTDADHPLVGIRGTIDSFIHPSPFVQADEAKNSAEDAFHRPRAVVSNRSHAASYLGDCVPSSPKPME